VPNGATKLDELDRREQAALRSLLIEATAAAGREADRARLEQLARDAPIEALPQAAALHRVSGSVLRGIDGLRGIPDDVLANLSALRQKATLHHLLITGVLAEVGHAFDETDLAWIAMKGPVAASLLYPEAGDRSYSDLDLLVEKRHFPTAVRTLEALGFQHAIRNWSLAESMLAGQIKMTRESVDVDLHWHVHYSTQDRRHFGLRPGAMIRRARRVDLAGVTAPTFDPVDTLLTLAFHAARSEGHCLVWLKDVERAVAVDGPDLDELVRRCDEQRCAPPVGLILDRSRALLGAPIPEEIIRSLTPATLLAAERVARAVNHPIQLHRRMTLTRSMTRSARSSTRASLTLVPTRAANRLRELARQQPENETDDPREKMSYLAAVEASEPEPGWPG
jgi:hypothetical protein